jgi:hypothetical protein
VKLTTCYAVVSGAYSNYKVHAVYLRREDAEAQVKANNNAASPLLDGHDDMSVEEFDYYEGEPLPAPLEEEK